MATKTRQEARLRRHARVRGKVAGTTERPRLAVYRSNQFTYAQVIDDVSGKTLASADSRQIATGDKRSRAREVGKLVADRAKAAGITRVVFDRGGYVYHGRIQALAEGAREGGLEF